MPAIGKSKAKVYSKKNTTKKAFAGHGTRTGPGTVKSKKKYADKFSDTKIKKYTGKPPMLGDSGFKAAYAKARGGGADKFTFKGKSYLTKKPSELKKKSLRERLTGYKTQSEYEAARTKRKKETRIARMEKRKGEGKSYSVSNLAALKMEKRGSPPKTKYITRKPKIEKKHVDWITKKTMPSVKKPS